jgi:hypothetical protein
MWLCLVNIRETSSKVTSMVRYRLHYFPESGNSYKLALMLTLCGEAFEPIWTDLVVASPEPMSGETR